jgi:hypothetical protein
LQPNWNASSPPRTRNQGLCVPRIQSLRYGLRLVVTPETILHWHRDIVRRRWAAQPMRSQDRPASHPPASLPRGVVSGRRRRHESFWRRRESPPRRAELWHRAGSMPRNFAGSTAGCGFLYPRPALALRTGPHARPAHGYTTREETQVAAAARARFCGGE